MSDDQELKSVLNQEFSDLESLLNTPGPVDPSLRKRVDSFILRNLHVLVMRNTVTESECRTRMASCAGTCTALEEKKKAAAKADGFDPSTNLSAYLFKEAMKWVPAPVLLFVYAVGKGNGWW